MASFRMRAVLKLNTGLLDKAARAAPRAARKALNEVTDHTLRRIKGAGPQPAPIRSGRLRRSYEKRTSHRGLRVLIRSDPTIAPHAPFVEFGTSRMRAQPHFRPAVRAARRLLVKRSREILARELPKS